MDRCGAITEIYIYRYGGVQFTKLLNREEKRNLRRKVRKKVDRDRETCIKEIRERK